MSTPAGVGDHPGRADRRRRGLAPLDRWTLGFTLVLTVALVRRWPAGIGGSLVAAHALLATVALLAPRAREAGRAGAFLGEFYPLFLLFAIYSEVGLLNVAAGISYDEVVQGWERAIFGFQPSLTWARAHPWPWLSGLLHGAYLAYYAIVAGVPLGFWIAGRRDAARHALLLVMATFYLCYTLSLVFPVAGPRYLFPLPPTEVTRSALAVFTHELIRAGSAWGTAFPSSHVAVALVASVCALRESPRLGAATLAATGLLVLATVYGQFHYAVDAIAGAAVGALVLVGFSASGSP
jgi:membrane-associated phospholipid phosphatase